MFIMCDGLVAMGQDNILPGIIPSLFYRGRITNRFDYNVFSSATFIPVRSTVDGHEYSSRNSEVYIQPSLVYKFSERVNFAIGYTYITGNSFTATRETEQQVWQQGIVEHRAVRGLMLHRLRLSEKFNMNMSVALNYQIAFEKPLQGRILDEGEFYFTFFNESFFNLTNQPTLYSANWTFAGLGFKTVNAGKFEVGPLIQATFNGDQGNNTLYLFQILWIADSKLFKRKG